MSLSWSLSSVGISISATIRSRRPGMSLKHFRASCGRYVQAWSITKMLTNNSRIYNVSVHTLTSHFMDREGKEDKEIIIRISTKVSPNYCRLLPVWVIGFDALWFNDYDLPQWVSIIPLTISVRQLTQLEVFPSIIHLKHSTLLIRQYHSTYYKK